MASKSQKRDIASFFKPYVPSIPAKRPSPSVEDDEVQYIMTKSKQTDLRTHEEVQYIMTKSKQNDVRTPQSAARFKNVTSSPCWSPTGPGSGGSVKIPIRSPRPKLSQKPVTSFSSRLSASYKDSPGRRQKDIAKPPKPSAPPFSFADLPSFTQSIVRGGKVVEVKGSDDEDSDSLLSLDDILGQRKSETVTSSSSPPELDADDREAERIRTMFQFTSGRSQPLVGRDKLRELNSKERDHKVDIGALMGDHFDDQEIEGNIAKAKQGYEAARQEEECSRLQGDVDRKLLAAVVAGERGAEDDMSRLMNAVERTEALNYDRSWSFFSPDCPKSPPAEPIEIATDAPLSDWWRDSLEDDQSRSRIFLSGFMGEVWSSGLLPDELIQWTFDNIIQEPRNELRRSFVQAFKHVQPEWLHTHIRSSTVERIFLRIGASRQAVSGKDLIEPAAHVSSTHEPDEYRYLLSVIETLMTMAPHLEFSSSGKLLAILARLSLDARVMTNTRVSVAVEDGMSQLIEISAQKGDLASARSFVTDFGSCLTDPTLQAQLLRHILCTSFLAAQLRIQLAHRFLLGIAPGSEADLSCWSTDITTLTRYLDSGPFDTTFRSPSKRLDYKNMTALTYLLDIAIADGGRPASFDSRAEEVTFNRKVDQLADRIKSIFASIADTGASHMRRTEAKEALQALHYRLLYAVRTEPRPKKSVFGGRDGEEYRAEERSKGFMTKFLARKKDKKSSKEAGQELLPNGSSHASKSESEEQIRRQIQLDA
jgi:hypothetical protein